MLENENLRNPSFWVGIVAAVIFVVIIFTDFFEMWLDILLFIITAIVTELICLAPHNIFGSYIKEGHLIHLGWGGQSFYKPIMRYEGKSIADDYEIIENYIDEKKIGKDGKIFKTGRKVKNPKIKKEKDLMDYILNIRMFGMNINPFWPFLRPIIIKDFEWTETYKYGKKEDKKKDVTQRLLPYFLYYVRANNVDTYGKIPLYLDIIVEMRVINAYKPFYNPENYIATMEKMVLDKVRSFVNKKYYDDLVRGTNEDISKGLQNELKEVISQLREVYGVDFKQISVIDIGPSDERFAKATKDAEIAKKQGEGKVAAAEFEAKAKIIASEAEATAFTQKVIGVAMKSLARYTGKNEEELINLREKNPEVFNNLYGDIYKESYGAAFNGIAMEKDSYFKLDGSSSGGGSVDMLTSVIVADKIINKNKGNKENTKGNKKSPYITDEEVDEILDRDDD
jgi:regulator of protease activity HflC (stomatin/prohibitin superfamily)